MTEEIKAGQTEEEVTSGQRADTVGASVSGRPERGTPKFNRFIYENLSFQIECQIDHWNWMAVREVNPESAHALWLKAEGLGYALRLLYAFKPEFDELVASAERTKCQGCGAELENRPYLPATDSDLCDSCYEIAHASESVATDGISGCESGNVATVAEGSAR